MIQDYLKAGYPVLMERTHEPPRFIGFMVKKINGRTPYQWDIVRGVSGIGKRGGMARGRPLRLPPNCGPGERKGGLVPAITKLPFHLMYRSGYGLQALLLHQ
jgi:hypothetical protein